MSCVVASPLNTLNISRHQECCHTESVLGKPSGLCGRKKAWNDFVDGREYANWSMQIPYWTHECKPKSTRCLCMTHLTYFYLYLKYLEVIGDFMSFRSLQNMPEIWKLFLLSHSKLWVSLAQTFTRNKLFKIIYFIQESWAKQKKSYAIKTIQFVICISKFHFFACFCIRKHFFFAW